jgi:hypothetical protein
MAAPKWYIGKLGKDVGRYRAGDVVPFKHFGKGQPTPSDYGHLFTSNYIAGPFKTKKAAWEKARG